MNDFPKMLYKAGGAEQIHGGSFSTVIVSDEAEQEQALADGWHLTTPEAKDAADVAKSGNTGDDGKPTRAELEQKATELGIKFDGRTGDKKLADLIAATLGGYLVAATLKA